MILDGRAVDGLSPLLVKEVFASSATSTRLGRHILLVEQNARAALSVASHGYIMEQGKCAGRLGLRIARTMRMSGILPRGAGDQRKSFKNLKSFKRRKRWL